MRAVGPPLEQSGHDAVALAAGAEEDEWLAKVAAALPDELRAAALGRLGGKPIANERHRLVELLTALGPVGRWLAGGDVTMFAHHVIDTRNQLAHPSRRPGARVLEGAALVSITDALGWCVRGVLLRRLGLSSAELDKTLRGVARALRSASDTARVLQR